MDGIQSYHDNTERNDVFAFVLKKMAARFSEISGEEIQKLVRCRKFLGFHYKQNKNIVNKNTNKTRSLVRYRKFLGFHCKQIIA